MDEQRLKELAEMAADVWATDYGRDVRELVAEVRRLRAEVERLTDYYEWKLRGH